ncbi:MAG: hypothetical protein HY047_00745 [Acidobacteria bacterium]|nr:hypothetical protein [Acidobacteriota bacterium]
MRARIQLSVFIVCVSWASSVFAQNWSFDARKIALGGVGTTDNLGTEMIDEQRPYRSIVLPFGLFQIASRTGVFDPSSSQFDPIRAIEYAASPLHYVVNRDDSDVRNAVLARDLNVYRGFTPPNSILAEGLTAPSWGGTIKVYRGGGGSFQGVYVGAGPYLSMRTTAAIPAQLTDILSSGTTVAVPKNISFPQITDDSLGQVAMAVTGGYRGRFAVGGLGGSERDGVYVAVNYNYLRGFRYENTHLGVRLDTDASGSLTVNPLLPSPVIATRQYATGGQGFALDFGVGAVVDHWEVGFGAKGIANRIDWTGVQQTTYSLGDPSKPLLSTLLSSGNATFTSFGPVAVADARAELPVDYRGNLGYHSNAWSALADYGQGLQGTSFHAGFEQRLSVIDLRGGMRYSSEIWNPSGGIGINVGRRIGLDVAAFGTSANLERTRHVALAASIRINSRR